jgi:capsular exopolysaccharide synthesis family protein
MNAALGLMGGMFLGVVFVVMRERADKSLQQPGDAGFYLDLPELGVIPSAHLARKHLYYYGKKRKELAEKQEEANDRVELVTWQRKPSLVADSFRAVLTSILFTGTNGKTPRVLVLSSAMPKEGKSTVASNLAIALAEVGRRVLLIDADMRKPRMHEIFELSNETGLVDLLKDGAMQAGAVQETTVPGLWVLTSGKPSAAAGILLFSQGMPRLLETFREEFGTIVIDTPPMLQMPDARVIGRVADGVILVTRAGVTTRDTALAAKQRFSEDGTRVLGTILNDWNPKRNAGGYYGYHDGYSRYYGRYYKDQKPEEST